MKYCIIISDNKSLECNELEVENMKFPIACEDSISYYELWCDCFEVTKCSRSYCWLCGLLFWVVWDMVTVWVFNSWPLLLRGERCDNGEHEGECRNTVSIRYYWYHNNTRAKSDRMWKINAKLVKGYRHIKGVDMEVDGMIEWWLLSVRSSWSFLIVKRVSL